MINVFVVGPRYLTKDIYALEKFSFEHFEESELNNLTQKSFFEIIQKKNWDVLIILYEIETLYSSNLNGFELFQHIRYSKKKEYQFSPIILTSVFSLQSLIKFSTDSAILNTPKSRFIQLPLTEHNSINILMDVINESLSIEELVSFIPIKKKDKLLSNHVFKNFEGMKLIYNQLKAIENDFSIPTIDNHIQQNKNALWYKRHETLTKSDHIQDNVTHQDLLDLRKIVDNNNVLLIDDLADEGWESIISYLLFKKTESVNLTSIKSNEEFAEIFMIDDSVLPEDQVNLDRHKWELNKRKKNIEKQLSANATKLSTLNSECESLESKVKELNIKIENNNLENAEETLRQSIESLFEVYDKEENKKDRNNMIKKIIEDLKESNREDNFLNESKSNLVKFKKVINEKNNDLLNSKQKHEEYKALLNEVNSELNSIVINKHNLKDYKLILLDLDLGTGKSDGLELLKQIRELNTLVPIIIFSSNEDVNTFLNLSEYSISGCFVKGKHGLRQIINIFNKNKFFFNINRNTWILYEKYKKLSCVDFFNGRFYKGQNNFELKHVENNEVNIILNLIRNIFLNTKDDNSMKFSALNLGSVQEMYVLGNNLKNNSGLYYNSDDAELRDLRNKAAHLNKWYQEKEEVKVMKLFQALERVIDKIYPY